MYLFIYNGINTSKIPPIELCNLQSNVNIEFDMKERKSQNNICDFISN